MYPKCKNTAHDHENWNGDRYGGYCLDCDNAGVPDLIAEIDRLRAENAELRTFKRCENCYAMIPASAEGYRCVMCKAMEAVKP